MRFVADLIYLLAGIAYLPVLLYQAVVLRKNRSGWGERFGLIPKLDPAVKRIWIHGVSLGEINATPKLVERLTAKIPGAQFVFSTTTDTGYARAVQLYGCHRVFRFPLDFSFVVNRVLRRVQPVLIVLVELEVWYNLLRSATGRGIPVAVVNGRLTERSARRLRWLGQPARTMFSQLSWVGTQDAAIADRFRQLGVTDDRLEVTSSLKWDSALITDRIDGADALAAEVGLDSARKVWVCGSTGPGEEAMILQSYAQWVSAPPIRTVELPTAESSGAVSEGAVSEGAVSESAVSEGAVSEGAVSEGAVSEGAVSKGAVSKGAVSKKVSSLTSPLSKGGLRGVARSEDNHPQPLLGKEGARKSTDLCSHSNGLDEAGTSSVPRMTDAIPPTLVIVPRKPERFDEVARSIVRAGFSCVRRSECRKGAARDAVNENAIILGDTMGELRKFYSLADVVFVGRTLVPMGGSDPMEVAAMRKPIVVGPHTDNFQLPVDALRRADAIRVIESPSALAPTIAEILSDKTLADGLAARAREVLVANQGATERTVIALAELLDG
jgi:3-deoxy-D-manno-octulosonic-acid transferase